MASVRVSEAAGEAGMQAATISAVAEWAARHGLARIL
jgi:hypothetical protein